MYGDGVYRKYLDTSLVWSGVCGLTKNSLRQAVVPVVPPAKMDRQYGRQTHTNPNNTFTIEVTNVCVLIVSVHVRVIADVFVCVYGCVTF